MNDSQDQNEQATAMKKARPHKKVPAKSVLEDSPSHLLHRVLQIALDIYNENAGEGALTQRQYAVLTALQGTEGQGMSQTDLVKATGIDRSTLADLVSRMLAKDLLKRERSLTDARANLVSIADGGAAALEDAQPRVLAADEKILGLLSPPKRDSFVKLLRKITTAREEELTAVEDQAAAAERAAKKAEKSAIKAEKKKAKRAGKAAKKLKKLPMPALSEGAATEEESVVVPISAA